MEQNVANIAVFVHARLDEDEQAARAARDPKWQVEEKRGTLTIDAGPWSMGWEFGGGSGMWQCDDVDDECGQYRSAAEAEAAHIARHDPARAMSEVKALRAVVKLHEPGDDGRCTSCIEYCGDSLYPTEYAKAPCAEVKLLARIWDWHPDYDPAWSE